jgi:hypothetical protein
MPLFLADDSHCNIILRLHYYFQEALAQHKCFFGKNKSLTVTHTKVSAGMSSWWEPWTSRGHSVGREEKEKDLFCSNIPPPNFENQCTSFTFSS